MARKGSLFFAQFTDIGSIFPRFAAGGGAMPRVPARAGRGEGPGGPFPGCLARKSMPSSGRGQGQEQAIRQKDAEDR